MTHIVDGKVDKFSAVYSLVGGGISNSDGVFTYHDGQTPPTEEAIQAEMERLQAEYDAKDYARKRKLKYPSLNDFAEAYTEKEIGGDSTKWDAYVINYNKVRSDNPK